MPFTTQRRQRVANRSPREDAASTAESPRVRAAHSAGFLAALLTTAAIAQAPQRTPSSTTRPVRPVTAATAAARAQSRGRVRTPATGFHRLRLRVARAQQRLVGNHPRGGPRARLRPADARFRGGAERTTRSSDARAPAHVLPRSRAGRAASSTCPRALFTEKAFPEDEAVITTTIVTDGLDSLSHEFLWEQRFGAREPDRDHVAARHAPISAIRTGWKSGSGRSRESASSTCCITTSSAASILSVGGELVLPTGDETHGFGNGTTVLESFVMYGKLLPQRRVRAGAGHSRVPARQRTRRRGGAAARARQDLDHRRAVRPRLDADASRCLGAASSLDGARDGMGRRLHSSR